MERRFALLAVVLGQAAAASRPAMPPALGVCDPLGCWTSDGERLQRMGPDTLVGPRGVCSAQGTLLHCPP